MDFNSKSKFSCIWDGTDFKIPQLKFSHIHISNKWIHNVRSILKYEYWEMIQKNRFARATLPTQHTQLITYQRRVAFLCGSHPLLRNSGNPNSLLKEIRKCGVKSYAVGPHIGTILRYIDRIFFFCLLSGVKFFFSW